MPAVRDKHTPVPLSKLFTAPPAIRLLLVPRGRAARPVYDENAADAAERCCEPARRPPDAAASARPGPDPRRRRRRKRAEICRAPRRHNTDARRRSRDDGLLRRKFKGHGRRLISR